MQILRSIALRARRNELLWRYAFNFAPTMAYRRMALSNEGERVLQGLNRDGIAMTSVSALLGECSLFDELAFTVERMERERAGNLALARGGADNVDSIGTKRFLVQLLGDRPSLEVGSIFARVALRHEILAVVNNYFNMYARLRDYNIWHNFVTSTAPRESQLWHRDREDLFIVKVFVYLSDVDEQAGPLTYAPGTHRKGPVRQTPESFDEKGVKRSSDIQMAKVVAAERWIRVIGSRGTIVFADTHGYHKGGHATGRDRILYNCMFTSPASESKEWFIRPSSSPGFDDVARTVAVASPRTRLWLTLPAPMLRNSG